MGHCGARDVGDGEEDLTAAAFHVREFGCCGTLRCFQLCHESLGLVGLILFALLHESTDSGGVFLQLCRHIVTAELERTAAVIQRDEFVNFLLSVKPLDCKPLDYQCGIRFNLL